MVVGVEVIAIDTPAEHMLWEGTHAERFHMDDPAVWIAKTIDFP